MGLKRRARARPRSAVPRPVADTVRESGERGRETEREGSPEREKEGTTATGSSGDVDHVVVALVVAVVMQCSMLEPQ